MKVYHLKVSLFDYYEQPISKLHRIIEISENSTFEDLHDAIFEAFDRFDPNLYTFFITKKDTTALRDIMDAPAITNPFSFEEKDYFNSNPDNTVTTTIKDANLNEKDVFHYWFDFGDDWWHRIRVEKITTNNRLKKAFAKITKKVGESPAQYDYDDKEVDSFDFEDFSFAMPQIDQESLNKIGITAEDFVFISDIVEEGNTEPMLEIVDRYGINTIIAMFKLLGIPNIKEIENILNNLDIMIFLESVEDPDITLSQERNLLETLIEKLQVRLSDLENKIADSASKVTSEDRTSNQSYK